MTSTPAGWFLRMLFGLAGVGWASLVAAPASGAESANAIEQALQSVVSVLPQWPRDARRSEEPEASGVVIGEGHTIVTAAHVIAKALSVRVRTADGTVMMAKVIGHDPASDLGFLSVKAKLVPIVLSRTDPGLGQPVCAIGNAFGLGLSVTCGVVSAVHRSGVGFNAIEDFVQTDAAVNPGASGGALVTRDGRLVGVLSAIFTKKSDANIGVNFAVSVRLMERMAEELLRTGRVARVQSGLVFARPTRRYDGGKFATRVIHVRPESPAARSGFRPGDRVIAAGGRPIRKAADFRAVIYLTLPPFEMPVTVVRDGQRKVLKLKIQPSGGLPATRQRNSVTDGR